MIEVYNRCRSRSVSPQFMDCLKTGWDQIFQFLKKAGEGVIRDLDGIEITLLDDAEMARVHGEFLNDPTTTDVITFDHGELLISVGVAARQARDFGSSPDREIALYGIHGMLHLSGYDDQCSSDAKVMSAKQDHLLGVYFKEIKG